MDIRVVSRDVLTLPADLLVVGLCEGELKGHPLLEQLDRALGGALRSAAADEGFAGKEKQSLVLHTLGKLRQKRVALLGLGRREGCVPAHALVRLGGSAVRLAQRAGAREAILVVPREADAPDDVASIARGAQLGTYAFRRYKGEGDNSKRPALARLQIAVPAAATATASASASSASASRRKRAPSLYGKALARAGVVAEAVTMARDLVNEPAIELWPARLADRALEVARKSGLGCERLDARALRRMGMGLLVAVGSGSAHPPELVHLWYEPRRGGRSERGRGRTGAGPSARRAPPGFVLVGKGITFDSGGLSLKPATSMETMKSDMAGAAAVLATLRALAALEVPFAVHAVLALAENMPSGTAVRPGDVVKSYLGKTVEIMNTDAEGRLILADALAYARKLAPKALIDVATLTGACVVALGVHTAGLFASHDALAEAVVASAASAGEHVWRLPLTPMLKEQLKSDVADLKNTGAREGGAITAALFLKEFVGDTPWAHLDIAGPAMSKGEGASEAKGGTGVAVATLVSLVMDRGAEVLEALAAADERRGADANARRASRDGKGVAPRRAKRR